MASDKEEKPFGGLDITCNQNQLFSNYINNMIEIRTTVRVLKQLTLEHIALQSGEDEDEIFERFDELYNERRPEALAEIASAFGSAS